MGRKTKLTRKVQNAICASIRGGNYVEVSAQAAGITPQTLRNWMKRGEEEGEGPYFEFFEAVQKAKAEAQMKMVSIIEDASIDSWQAAAWWLERTDYKRWGRKDRAQVEHTGKDGGPIETIDRTALAAQEFDEILERIKTARNRCANDPGKQGSERDTAV